MLVKKPKKELMKSVLPTIKLKDVINGEALEVKK